ncbi:DUF2846 domain-containing protein [Mariprofundus sp. NF]|uniref:DUF2846 domain-containing protein n=1 Tax=Mariprofundus sp. NF TaxID=2608716 RepID=UPI00159FBCFC|nr:DUF2846 domain-containing protein [Mariprofundus sp. NF]NWF39637.1 DUF2846 domain-containing protein [Mariprofundus sp. NF]
MNRLDLITKLFAATLILLTASCVSLGSKFQPVEITDQSKAVVIFYRPADLCNITDPFYISANKKTVAALGNDAYTSLTADPGNYTVTITNIVTRFTNYNQGSEQFDFEAGKIYYIKYHRICKLFAPDINFVDAIEEKIAHKELLKMGYTKPMLESLSNPNRY